MFDFPEPFGPDDHGHAPLEAHLDRLRERLEAAQLDRSQVHAGRKSDEASGRLELRERLAGRFLLGSLLRRPLADAGLLAVDHGRAREHAVVRRPLDLEHRVRDRLPETRERLLQLGLVVDVRRQRVLDPSRRRPRRSRPRSARTRPRGRARRARPRAARPARSGSERAASARPAERTRPARPCARRARARARRRRSSPATRRASGSWPAAPPRSPDTARRAPVQPRARARCRRGTPAARTTTRGQAPTTCA